MKSTNKIILILATFMMVVGAIALWQVKSKQSLTLSKAPQGGDFTLYSAKGPFDLKAQRGKVVLVYFGYTFCPDVCPTNLALLAQAFNALDKDELARVQGVFISVDPERDTLDKLSAYTRYFHPAITGVTGTPEQVAWVAKHYGAVYRKVVDASGGAYLIDHSANTYVIAPDGTLHMILPHATPPQVILKVIRSLLNPDQSKQSY